MVVKWVLLLSSLDRAAWLIDILVKVLSLHTFAEGRIVKLKDF